MVSGSTRSGAFLIKYIGQKIVHRSVLASKIGSESRFRRFSGCKHMVAARLEWFRRNLKFHDGTLRYRGETAFPTLIFLEYRGFIRTGTELPAVSGSMPAISKPGDLSRKIFKRFAHVFSPRPKNSVPEF